MGSLAGWGPLSVEIIVDMTVASPLPPKTFFFPLTSFFPRTLDPFFFFLNVQMARILLCFVLNNGVNFCVFFSCESN